MLKKIIIATAVVTVTLILLQFISPGIFDKARESSSTNPAAARVISIADGDTITVEIFGETEKVRLLGIDTPEKNHPEKAVQCFASEAEEYLRNKLEGATVRLESDPTNTNRDRYDRLLRYVYADGELVNVAIVEDGYGFAYTGFPLIYEDQIVAAEQNARSEELGLWSGCEVYEEDGRSQTEPA